MIRSISSSDSEDDVTEQERILKSSNIFKQKDQGHNSCVKHPNKKAKYYAQCDRSKLFCSKCALNLALKGLKIEETQDLELQRQNRICKFQDQLRQTLEQCSLKLNELAILESTSQRQLLDMKDNCIQFFDSVISTAHQLKETYIQKFETDHMNLVTQVQEKLSGIKNLDAQLRQFEIDIAENHENIVKKMEMKPFDEIMKRYEQRVTHTRIKLSEFHQEFQPKTIKIEKNQILANMNKMCYNLLLNSEVEEQKVTISDSPKKEPDMKVFEILEAEDIYQSTCSNQIKEHLQSPPKQQQSQKQKGSTTYSNPLSAIQNSRRESHTNTPESWQLRTCVPKTNPLVTPNERESFKHNVSVGEQLISQKCPNPIETYDKYFVQTNEKQKTTTEYERTSEKSNQPLMSNLSCLYMAKKEPDRKSYEDRELTPKHQKNLTSGPQTFKLLTNHASQRSQYQYPQVNNNLFEQKSQKELSKAQYDSVPNQKSLTPHHVEPQSRINPQKQDVIHKRSNSKQPKQPSIDQIEGRRQFILSNIPAQQYTSQPSQNAEDTLKDRIFKELCTHPGESVYNQVLKLNNQTKLKNQKIMSKENIEQSTTVRNKNNGFLCMKKQSQH